MRIDGVVSGRGGSYQLTVNDEGIAVVGNGYSQTLAEIVAHAIDDVVPGRRVDQEIRAALNREGWSLQLRTAQDTTASW